VELHAGPRQLSSLYGLDTPPLDVLDAPIAEGGTASGYDSDCSEGFGTHDAPSTRRRSKADATDVTLIGTVPSLAAYLYAVEVQVNGKLFQADAITKVCAVSLAGHSNARLPL
jgi:hypothetical protein